jgi:hypothetical protein
MYTILLNAIEFKFILWINENRRIEWRKRSLKCCNQQNEISHHNEFDDDKINPILQNELLCKNLIALTSFTVHMLQQKHFLCDVLSQCENNLLVLHLMGVVETSGIVVSVEYDLLQCIASNCSKLSVLRISNCHVMSHIGLTAVCASNARLLVVNMHHCHLDDDAVFAIAYGCKHIQSLDISSNYNVSDASILCVSDCCPSLTSIDITETQVSQSAKAELLKNCKMLRYVAHDDDSVAY